MALNVNARLLEIVDLSGFKQLNPQEFKRLNPRECWLDGDECPYGQPGGKFLDRPKNFCQLSVCHKLDDLCDELEELYQGGKYFEERVDDAVEEEFNAKSKKLSELIGEIANQSFASDEEAQMQGVLLLAAEVLLTEGEVTDCNPLVVEKDMVVNKK